MYSPTVGKVLAETLIVVVPLAVTAPLAAKSGVVVDHPPWRLKFSDVASAAADPKVSVELRLTVAGVEVSRTPSPGAGVDGHAARQACRSLQLQYARIDCRGAGIGVRAAEGQRAAADLAEREGAAAASVLQRTRELGAGIVAPTVSCARREFAFATMPLPASEPIVRLLPPSSAVAPAETVRAELTPNADGDPASERAAADASSCPT